MSSQNPIKSKKGSKLKHTEPYDKKFNYNSPSKVHLPSSFRPKGPPNISNYHQMQKKHQTNEIIKNEYYHQHTNKESTAIKSNGMFGNSLSGINGGQMSAISSNQKLLQQSQQPQKSQQPFRLLNNYIGSCYRHNDSNDHEYQHRSRDQMITVSTNHHNFTTKEGKIREKRHTHAHVVEIKKSCQNSNGFQYLKMERALNGKENKGKSYLNRQPIPLGALKNKTRLLRSDNKKKMSILNHHKDDKQRSSQKNLLKKQKLSHTNTHHMRTTLTAEDKQCSLHCWENILVQKTSSMQQSKVSLSSHNPNQHLGDTRTSSTLFNHQHEHVTHLNSSQVLFQQDQHIKGTLQKSIHLPIRRSGFHTRSPKPYLAVSSPKKTVEEQLQQFAKKMPQINMNFQHDCLFYMQERDQQLTNSKNLNCYLQTQQYLDWKKRAIIINWMIEVLSQIGGKRQTLANAVNIFDKYLSQTHNIQRDQFQCVAVSCMLIAAKLEDKTLSASYLSDTTLNKYTSDEITNMEWDILIRLGFKVNMPTLNSWANRLATQWDMYLEAYGGYGIIADNMEEIKFKSTQQKSYYNYRQLCQYVDFSIMDLYTLRYQPRMISLAFIYLIMVMKLNMYTKEEVSSTFPYSSQFLLEMTEFNEFFCRFLKDSFQLQALQLLPMIQYCATFVILPLKFDLPEAVKENEDEIHYEEFCSFQTRNQATFGYLSKRCRDII